MKINQTKTVQVEAKLLKIYVKCSDRFSCSITDQDGHDLAEQDDGYVPDFMPGEHYGDYIILDIDLDTGVVVNWKKPSSEQIEEFVEKMRGEE